MMVSQRHVKSLRWFCELLDGKLRPLPGQPIPENLCGSSIPVLRLLDLVYVDCRGTLSITTKGLEAVRQTS